MHVEYEALRRGRIRHQAHRTSRRTTSRTCRRLLDEQYKKNVVEFLKYEENRKASRKGRKKFGGIMMMQVPGAGPEGGFVQVPVATGGAKMIQACRDTRLGRRDAARDRVVIDYGDI